MKVKNRQFYFDMFNPGLRKICMAWFISLFLPSLAFSQETRIAGTVFDDSGPLSGVAVLIKGTNQGVASNDNGEFSIAVPSDTTTLQFIYSGYLTKDVKVGRRKVIAVQMTSETTELEEVTVVAFGTQRKESVIGSITSVNVKDLKVPSSNLTTALAGNMAGVIAYQRSGEPGADNADFFVRGITTFGTNTNPLILIDNVELTTTDLARLQPDDIASFSIMKDATATALYGARGANGVILVTTRQGNVGPAKVSVRLENSVSMPTRNVETADPVTFMQLANEAVLTRDRLGARPYPDEKIAYTAAERYPLIYPANDWHEMLFKDYAMNQRAHLNVSGGGGVARYYVAASFSKDNGVLSVDKRNNFNSNIDQKNYTLRSNVNIDVTKTTEMIVRLSGNFDDYQGPISSGNDMYNMVMHANPVQFPAYFPAVGINAYVPHIMFGNHDNAYTNPYAEMVKGYKDKTRSQMLAQIEVKQNLDFLTKGLSARGMINITRLAEYSVDRSYTPYWYEITAYNRLTGDYMLEKTFEGKEYLDYKAGAENVESVFYSEAMLNYAREFAEKHSVSGLLVFTTQQRLLANPSDIQLSLPSRNMGLSGRLTYAYKNRYFTEFNFGYNGSERFDKEHRFGFFPSAGVAWNIANEAFWESVKPTVNNFKLRYSYGLVGNDQIGSAADRFYYLSRVAMDDTKRQATFGTNGANRTIPGVFVERYANPSITWEVSTKQNFALELSLWSKLNLIAEYFTEYRRNILMDRADIPSTMGLTQLPSPMRANVGEASSKGVDITMDYQQSWNKDFWTSARANFTYASGRYEVYEEPLYNEPWRQHAGRRLNQTPGYIAERLFMDDAETENSPAQAFGSEIGGGDIKYTDVNGDGQITAADMVPVGYPTVPEIVYGFGLSVGYKGFDASVFFQGAAKESFWIDATKTAPFQGETQLLQVYADSHWSETNQDMYAVWPRLSSILNANNVQSSTWFMRDGAFLRLKQAEIGYTFPSKRLNKIHISNCRIYLSGNNLLLFSKFKLWDVEMAGNGLGYPIQRVFNIGLNLTFN
jgi:TonB-linked SusC/RagA family outer membrane protein